MRPHWRDLNGDRRIDLVFWTSDRSRLATDIFIRNDGQPGNAQFFKLLLTDSTQHLSVLDLGRDGRVEFVGSAFPSAATSDGAAEMCKDLPYTQEVLLPSQLLHESLVDVADSTNLKSDGLRYAFSTQDLIGPLMIRRLVGDVLTDVTREFAPFVRQRLNAVELMRPHASASCAEYLGRVETHLRQVLK